MAIGIGLLGLGTVGAGVAQILQTPDGRHPLVKELELRQVAVRNLERARPVELAEPERGRGAVEVGHGREVWVLLISQRRPVPKPCPRREGRKTPGPCIWCA